MSSSPRSEMKRLTWGEWLNVPVSSQQSLRFWKICHVRFCLDPVDSVADRHWLCAASPTSQGRARWWTLFDLLKQIFDNFATYAAVKRVLNDENNIAVPQVEVIREQMAFRRESLPFIHLAGGVQYWTAKQRQVLLVQKFERGDNAPDRRPLVWREGSRCYVHGGWCLNPSGQ